MPPEPDPATPAVLTVRFRRRLHPWAFVGYVVGCLPLAIAVDIFFPSRPGFQWVLVIAGLISCLAGAAVVDRTQKVQFTYDRSSRTIRARDRLWGTWRTYPRKNFERLERSTDPRGVFEVRADGERHRLDIGGGLAHPDDWKTFLECFLEDHAARDTPPDPDTTHT